MFQEGGGGCAKIQRSHNSSLFTLGLLWKLNETMSMKALGKWFEDVQT